MSVAPVATEGHVVGWISLVSHLRPHWCPKAILQTGLSRFKRPVLIPDAMVIFGLELQQQPCLGIVHPTVRVCVDIHGSC